jgi:TPR repeat protein
MNMDSEEIKIRAEKGSTPMQIALGHSYLIGKDWDGNPIPVDYKAARIWIEKAASKGASTAIFLLGTLYEEGLGVEVNIDEAVSLYKKAAERGAYLPCVHLARIYANERNECHSKEEAATWYQRVLTFEGDVDGESEMAEAKAYLKAIR